MPAGQYNALYTAVEIGLTSNNTTTTSTLASSFATNSHRYMVQTQVLSLRRDSCPESV
eukprot:m.292445 g.292445  ORF g.292445 m.292445 type:complete len:58 (+) comp17826_c0_seq8:5533-5706(+)